MPVINVGNLSTGGTGKTPHTEYLIRLLKGKRKVFTLSRGFGRKERGFIIAGENATAKQIGDEPLQFYSKYGADIGVAVEANRVLGVMDICRIHPETDLVLLDDAFQHRAIQPGLNILITAYNSPFYADFILPVGNLREFRSGKKRADVIVVSKCPDFDQIDKAAITRRINPAKNQSVFFSKMNYGRVYALQNSQQTLVLTNQKVILVTGIANAKPLVNKISENNTVLHHFEFRDHYNFKEADITEIHNLFGKFASENPVIITTEKDGMRLLDPTFSSLIENKPWFCQSIEVELDKTEEFNKIVNEYLEKNS